MKAILIITLIGVIGVCWIVANAFNKPILNRMSNYYEDDKDGRYIANMLISVMLLVSFLIGYIVA